MGPKKKKNDVTKNKIKTTPKQNEVVVEELYKTSNNRYTDESSDSFTEKESSYHYSWSGDVRKTRGARKKRDSRRKRDDEDFLKSIDSEIVIQSVVYKNSAEKEIESDTPRPTSEPTFEGPPLVTTQAESLVIYKTKSNRKFNLEEKKDDECEEEEGEKGEREEEEGREDENVHDKLEEPEIEVIFDTISEESMMTKFSGGKTIKDVKEKLGSIFKVDSEVITLMIKGKEYDDGLRLSELGESPSTITFDISSSKPKQFSSPGQFQRYKHFKRNQLVKIRKDEGKGFQEINVEVENQCYFNKWLGGFRNKRTNKEYHNKMVQTLPRMRRPDEPKIYSRETQTPAFPFKEFESITSKNKSTQMSRSDFYVPNITDKIIIGNSNRYEFDSGRMRKRFADLVMNIENVRLFIKKLRYFRTSHILERNLEMRLQNEQKAKDTIHEALIAANRREIVGTTFPNDREDFYMLYLMIGKWWTQQMKTIANTKRKEARKAAVYDLLNKEVQLLCVIDRKRNKAKNEILAKQEITFLETTARPIIFRNNKGQMSSLDNVETQQAREYQEILSSFLRRNVTVEQRIDILQNLKNLIIHYDCYETSKQVLDLIDRECYLLSIGMTDKHLNGLRLRILQLLQFYLHKYEINPRSKKYEKPRSAKTVKTLYMCNSCKQLKHASDFNVHVRMTKFEICHSCEWMNNIACKRQNLSPYARLLQQVRESEMKKCCVSSVCYVLQPVGMTYLTQKIWEDQSVISECKRIDELRMIRFRKNEDWSPWNCILLTLEESTAHDQILNVDEFYDQWLLRKIHYKHLRAKSVFLPLILNDWQMRHSGLWFDVTDADKFLHPSHIQKFATSGDFAFFQ